MQNFFYRDKLGKEIGPLNLSTLAQLRFAGVLNDDTPVRSADSEKWMPCREVVAAPSAPAQTQPVSTGTGKAPIPPFVVVLILVGALIYGGMTLYKSIAAKTTLSYGFSVDGKKLSALQLPEVQVDGQSFDSGSHLKPGRHEISVSLENVEPYKQHFWVFYGDKNLGVLPLEFSKGSLSVTVNPSPATVIVQHDGETLNQGTAPLTAEKLPVGSYTLIVKRGDYQETRTVEIQRQQNTNELVALNLGIVQLSSAPADAEYTLSGNGHHWQGKLPARIEDVPVGNYTLSATRRDWELDSDISAARGAITTNTTEFPYGSIEVTSEPTGLVVSTNGVEIGKTPVTLQELKPAQYTLTVSDGENDLTADVNVAPNEAVKHVFAFHYGAVKLSSTPAGAVVIRKGRGIGKTPLTLDRIPAGETLVELQLQDYASTNFTIQAVEGVTVDLSVKLISEQYLRAMKKAQEAFEAGQFTDSQTAIAAVLEMEPNDPVAIELRNEVTNAVAKAEEAARQKQADDKAHMLASLKWLDFSTVISDCTDKILVQYPVEFNDGYYDNTGKYHITGQHTEMRTRTDTSFNPIKFSQYYAGRIFGFNCPGQWTISKIEQDGSITFKGTALFDKIVATPPLNNPNAFQSLLKGQKVTIKVVASRIEHGFVNTTLYLENAEILDK